MRQTDPSRPPTPRTTSGPPLPGELKRSLCNLIPSPLRAGSPWRCLVSGPSADDMPAGEADLQGFEGGTRAPSPDAATHSDREKQRKKGWKPF